MTTDTRPMADTAARFYKLNSHIEPDARDAEILDQKEAAWAKREGPCVGDFVVIGDRYGRFSHKWQDGLQWSDGGSFYLFGECASFSGGLNQTIPFDKLTLTDEGRLGDFWFFHHGHAGAHRGVGCRIPCRVYRAKTQFFDVTTDGTTHRVEAVDRSDAWSQGVRAEAKLQGREPFICWYPKEVKVEEVKAIIPHLRDITLVTTAPLDLDAFYRWLNPEELTHEEKYSRDRLLRECVEVDEATYWEFLEMLPPMHFNGRDFAMCEATTSDIRLAFFVINGRWFAAQVSDVDGLNKMAPTKEAIAHAAGLS